MVITPKERSLVFSVVREFMLKTMPIRLSLHPEVYLRVANSLAV